ncbi:hypothetical protein HDU87_000320 [Geranomyces variabilis]|uniref:Uncharacterized protein n=1 Tax=Geranomyces variabilis TaxID=109894 RepID=A0AAD5XSB4_9FUNG|nr:hypothetical protein HDU87_000320 [Geranomyces variabilis]
MDDDETRPCDGSRESPAHEEPDDEPPVQSLIVDDDVKFRDLEGNILDIEMCGERTFDGLRILPADVSTKLLEKEPRLLKNMLIHKQGSFDRGADFCLVRIKKDGPERIFLTWLALIRVLNRSQSPLARLHCMQAAKMLYVTQLASADEKEDLILENFWPESAKLEARAHIAEAELRVAEGQNRTALLEQENRYVKERAEEKQRLMEESAALHRELFELELAQAVTNGHGR